MANAEYVVHNEPRVIGQAKRSSCWSTCYEMVFKWKGLTRDDVRERLTSKGFDYWKMQEDGLLPQDAPKAGRALGLVAMHPTAINDPQITFHLLRTYGPLWVGGAFITDSEGLHANVVVGVRAPSAETRDASGCEVRLLEPYRGKGFSREYGGCVYWRKYPDFIDCLGAFPGAVQHWQGIVMVAGMLTNCLESAYLAESKGYSPDYGVFAAALRLPRIVGLLLRIYQRNGQADFGGV